MRLSFRYLTCLVLFIGQASAEVINYQGRLSVSGAPWTGVSRFKFALIGDPGAVLWSSSAIKLNVSNGAYVVRLGDSAQAPPIPDAVFRSKTPPKLRIWFDRGEKGWATVGGDVALTGDRPANGGIDAGQDGALGPAILAELHEIRALLGGKQGGTRPPEQQVVTVSTAGAPSLGREDAPLVLVEFTDFQCSYCIKFDQEVFARLKEKFVNSGKLRVVSRNLPLPFHPFAEPAARAAFCAAAKGKFWPMRERLFGANGALSAESIKEIAKAVGLDSAELDACTASSETAAAVQKGIQEAKAVGIEATPTFVLGRPVGDKVTGLKVIGALPIASFEAEINKQLPSEKAL